ncbi:F-box/RNI-like/FBD-like domains-containing protein [Arabidopsis thaliana]|uniref:F-box/FBD/LRR-repeat protein At3g51530 n=1 Tax=Arabidopsis thaliana TaxID=3702 RepID=FDL20_ARATH|nr:F-box/RNI-like/FBD-like domains-containing protein [Arabidopsis thaliana]Q501E9.1 RecName: Full=F-box/FBD/LRR-repeat protein At3g51530 [Arabidopsis thaliana]AAY25430.1 At3g51530 [Arabidopsis thaliana]ABJ17151.1 At3g51530 [Arabidopsis thaliana]AEE78803.1 F-box/RNI-like/FBD-like domains-containing protein [Arabidopsis thaliana]BAF01577.1 hypothetical protein [Arabidopsis thaliana]|eukprot:NP_190721.3 F-box/RNI-like/FBD-like domains-containing protein [Arabidopsis thaliana]
MKNSERFSAAKPLMEQGGKSSRKPGFMSEDRISELPEVLLLQILSSLPTKLVISTSVLSKRWLSLWKMVQRLEFESSRNIYDFAENVTRSLLSHKAPVLESLHLKVGDQFDGVYVGVWATIAFTRHVREFVLDLSSYHGPRVRFPTSLFCFDTLETLKLDYVYIYVPCPVSMKSLRTLHLLSVVYKGDESGHNLFASCPNLEHLVLRRGFFFDAVVNFIIDAPSLKTLLLSDPFSARESSRGYVIKAPSLKYLGIESVEGFEYFLIENVTELVEANIRNVSKIVNENILGSLKSAKRLSLDLSPLKITYPTEVMYHQLVYLEMHTHKVEWWNLLTHMLDSSPKLQVLKLIDRETRHENLEFDKKYKDQGKWNQPKYVPECLETFMWRNCNWGREEEKEVATYILRNARQLKKATFSTDPIEAKRLCKLAKRRKMREELDGVVMTSNSCHLVFEFE